MSSVVQLAAAWYGAGSVVWWVSAGLVAGVAMMLSGLWLYSFRLAHHERPPGADRIDEPLRRAQAGWTRLNNGLLAEIRGGRSQRTPDRFDHVEHGRARHIEHDKRHIEHDKEHAKIG